VRWNLSDSVMIFDARLTSQWRVFLAYAFVEKLFVENKKNYCRKSKICDMMICLFRKLQTIADTEHKADDEIHKVRRV